MPAPCGIKQLVLASLQATTQSMLPAPPIPLGYLDGSLGAEQQQQQAHTEYLAAAAAARGYAGGGGGSAVSTATALNTPAPPAPSTRRHIEDPDDPATGLHAAASGDADRLSRLLEEGACASATKEKLYPPSADPPPHPPPTNRVPHLNLRPARLVGAVLGGGRGPAGVLRAAAGRGRVH